jgi:hypothetical protein
VQRHSDDELVTESVTKASAGFDAIETVNECKKNCGFRHNR